MYVFIDIHKLALLNCRDVNLWVFRNSVQLPFSRSGSQFKWFSVQMIHVVPGSLGPTASPNEPGAGDEPTCSAPETPWVDASVVLTARSVCSNVASWTIKSDAPLSTEACEDAQRDRGNLKFINPSRIIEDKNWFFSPSLIHCYTNKIKGN